jgi:hypothetical protein
MEVANFGIESDYNFAVDLKHKAEHAVRGRVLRSHVQDHVLIACAFSGRSLQDWGSDIHHQR